MWNSANDVDYSQEVSDCIQNMINNAMAEELRAQAQQRLNNIASHLKDLSDELTSDKNPQDIMENAEIIYGRIFNNRGEKPLKVR